MYTNNIKLEQAQYLIVNLFTHILHYQLMMESGRATPGSSNAVTENSTPGLSGCSVGRTAITDW